MPAYEEDYGQEHEEITVIPCPNCGRNFNPQSLVGWLVGWSVVQTRGCDPPLTVRAQTKHQTICAKVSTNAARRGVFNSYGVP